MLILFAGVYVTHLISLCVCQGVFVVEFYPKIKLLYDKHTLTHAGAHVETKQGKLLRLLFVAYKFYFLLLLLLFPLSLIIFELAEQCECRM